MSWFSNPNMPNIQNWPVPTTPEQKERAHALLRAIIYAHTGRDIDEEDRRLRERLSKVDYSGIERRLYAITREKGEA